MYSQLKKELVDKTLELAAFNEQYPVLNIERVFPEDIVTQVFNKFYMEYNNGRLDELAYLNSSERDGIDLGNQPTEKGAFQVQQINKHIENEIQHLQTDLLNTIHEYTLLLKSLYLKWSKYSATHTAELMDTQYTLTLDVHKALKALADYYINICSKPSMAKNLPFSFHTTKNTLPATSGLYFICFEGAVVYVGHSININQRVRNHKLGPTYYCDNELECVTSEIDIEKAKELESQIIYILRPKENTYSKS